MAVSEIGTKSEIVNGQKFTSQLTNDKLQSSDFLKIILEGFKNQDPTKPKDVDNLIENQLKLSTIQTNVSLAEDMKALKTSYTSNTLYSSSNLIGQIVEDGSITDDGSKAKYLVGSVFSKDNALYANVKELVAVTDVLVDSTTNRAVKYDADGALYDIDGNKTDIYIKLKNQRFDLDNGNIQLVDSNKDPITDTDILSKYIYNGAAPHYSEQEKQIPIKKIQKIGLENT